MITSSTGLSPRPLGTASIVLMTSICSASGGGGGTRYREKASADWHWRETPSHGDEGAKERGEYETNAIQDLAKDNVLAVQPLKCARGCSEDEGEEDEEGRRGSEGHQHRFGVTRPSRAPAGKRGHWAKLTTHQLVTTVQMKNWEPLVSRPALAIESVPAPVCLSLKFSSLNLSP